jgi:hypothetical protein
MSFPCIENVMLLALTIQHQLASIYIFWLPLWCPKTLLVRFGRVWSIVKKNKIQASIFSLMCGVCRSMFALLSF